MRRFKLTVDTNIDFMEYIEDQSIYWMGPNYEIIPKTRMLESIRDYIYDQTNRVNISEMSPGKNFEDYPDDTIFILDDFEEDNWEEEEKEYRRKAQCQ